MGWFDRSAGRVPHVLAFDVAMAEARRLGEAAAGPLLHEVTDRDDLARRVRPALRDSVAVLASQVDGAHGGADAIGETLLTAAVDAAGAAFRAAAEAWRREQERTGSAEADRQAAAEERMAALAARREALMAPKREAEQVRRAAEEAVFAAAHPRGPKPEPQPFGVSDAGAEELAAAWMRWMGALDAEVTRFSGDGGVDVQSFRWPYIAQVKNYTGSVAVAEIRELAGVAAADPMGRLPVFFTSGTYPASAVEFAATVHMALFRYDAVSGELFPVNAPAGYMFGKPLLDRDELLAAGQAGRLADVPDDDAAGALV